jgi:uncharacterized RDD family membrane protein YckC
MNDAPYIRRFFALIFDLMITASLFCGVLMIVQYLEFNVPIHTFMAADQTIMLKAYGWFAGFYFIYELFFSALLSATPGKILVNIEDEYYRGHTALNVILRSLIKSLTVLLGPLPIVISFVVALTKQTKSVHDLAARTRVTDETRSPRLIGLFFLAAAIAVFVYFYSKNLKGIVFDYSNIKFPTLYS